MTLQSLMKLDKHVPMNAAKSSRCRAVSYLLSLQAGQAPI
jgi:hypothetical protein